MANYARRENTGSGDRTYYTGFTLMTPRMINPTKEQKAEMIGYDLKEDSKDISYEGKTRDGEEYITMEVWGQTPDGHWLCYKNMFIDKEVTEVDKEGNILTTQYVNQVGGKKKIDKESNLSDNFTKFLDKSKQAIADKIYRKSIQGEAKWYNFLTAWLNHVDPWSAETNHLMDIKKLFRNPDKFIQDEYMPHIKAQLTLDKLQEDKVDSHIIKDQLQEMWTEPILVQATVSIGDKDGQPVFYQQVFREVLPGYCMKNVETAIRTNSWKDKKLEYMVQQLTGEYNKEQYSLSLLQEWVPGQTIASTNDTIRHEANAAPAVGTPNNNESLY